MKTLTQAFRPPFMDRETARFTFRPSSYWKGQFLALPQLAKWRSGKVACASGTSRVRSLRRSKVLLFYSSPPTDHKWSSNVTNIFYRSSSNIQQYVPVFPIALLRRTDQPPIKDGKPFTEYGKGSKEKYICPFSEEKRPKIGIFVLFGVETTGRRWSTGRGNSSRRWIDSYGRNRWRGTVAMCVLF